MTPDTLGRIGKYFMDTQQLAPEEATRRLSEYPVALVCGPEVMTSPTLQAAVLTAANAASRCFPGAVRVHGPPRVLGAPLALPWPGKANLAQALAATAGSAAVAAAETPSGASASLLFGSCPRRPGALQVTFNGWAAAVGPADRAYRLAETEGCVLAGMAAGGLGVSEIFMAFAGAAIEATHRTVGLSLWRPDLSWEAPEALGVPVEYLPDACWVLGLGHLGQAYLWGLGLLPFAEPAKVRVVLQDFDRIVQANWDTGLLTARAHLGWRKTRVALSWLQARGFDPDLIEHRFDNGTRRYAEQPEVALCGFDGQGPRHLLDQAGFVRVIECGLGGTAANFDAISMHTLPGPIAAAKIWPSRDPDAEKQAAEQLAAKNPAYQHFHACGRAELAGRSVAAPFVGAVAGAAVLSEWLRMLHEGMSYFAMDVRLEMPFKAAVQSAGSYRGGQRPALGYLPAKKMTEPTAALAGQPAPEDRSG